MKTAALCSFGKDSLFAIYKYGKVDRIIMTDITFPRPSPHILNYEIAKIAAERMGVKLRRVKLRKGFEKEDLANALIDMDRVIAGNIFLEEHKQWLEEVANMAGVDYREPIWNYDTSQLLRDVISAGFEPLIVGVDTKKMGMEFLGKIIDEEMAESILNLDIDPCGEYGEYHTMVLNSPLYSKRIEIDGGERIVQDGYGLFKARVRESPKK